MSEQPQQPVTDADTLKQIAEHLASIRSMLKFFTFITVLGIIFSLLGGLLSF